MAEPESNNVMRVRFQSDFDCSESNSDATTEVSDQDDDDAYLAFPERDGTQIFEETIKHKMTLSFDERLLEPNYVPCKDEMVNGEAGMITLHEFSDMWKARWKVYGTINKWARKQRWMSLYVRCVEGPLPPSMEQQVTFSVLDQTGKYLHTRRGPPNYPVCLKITTGFTYFMNFPKLLNSLCPRNALILELELVLSSPQPQLGWHILTPQLVSGPSESGNNGTDPREDPDIMQFARAVFGESETRSNTAVFSNPYFLEKLKPVFSALKEACPGIVPSIQAIARVPPHVVPQAPLRVPPKPTPSAPLEVPNQQEQVILAVEDNGKIMPSDVMVSLKNLKAKCGAAFLNDPTLHIWTQEGHLKLMKIRPTESHRRVYDVLRIFQNYIQTQDPGFSGAEDFSFLQRALDVADFALCNELMILIVRQMLKVMRPDDVPALMNVITSIADHNIRIFDQVQDYVRENWNIIRCCRTFADASKDVFILMSKFLFYPAKCLGNLHEELQKEAKLSLDPVEDENVDEEEEFKDCSSGPIEDEEEDEEEKEETDEEEKEETNEQEKEETNEEEKEETNDEESL